MSWNRYSPEFSKQAVKQVIEFGYSAKEVSKRLDVPLDYVNAWLVEHQKAQNQERSITLHEVLLENIQLKHELSRLKKLDEVKQE